MDQNSFMMAGGMPPQGMQRSQPGNENDQIHGKIMEELRKMTMPQGGWQITLDLRERANWIMQLQSAMRLLQLQPPNTIMRAVTAAIGYEVHSFNNSPSKDQYVATIKSKLTDFHKARQHHALQNSMLQPQQNNFQMPQQAMNMQTPMQLSRSNQGEMPGSVPPQLQQPFQPSPMNAPVQNANMQAMSQQQRQLQALTQEEKTHIQQQATQMMNSIPGPQADIIRRSLLDKIPPERRQAHPPDPLPRHFFQLCFNKYIQAKAQQSGQGKLQNIAMDGNQPSNTNMQRPASQQGMMTGPNIDFASFAGQQADAMKMQDAGQLVVPASTNPNGGSNNNTGSNNNNAMDASTINLGNVGQTNMSQPGMMNNPAQVQALLAQRQQQLHRDNAAMRNSQQLQAAAQAQARTAAQAAAQQQHQQQMLRGQPGGLNTTTQPPQQSPAMSMLNRPMVPPGQQGGTTPQQRSQPPFQQSNPQMNPQMMTQMQQHNMNANPAIFVPTQKAGMTIPEGLPAHVKQKILTMTDEQAKAVIQKILSSGQHLAPQAQGMPANMLNNGNNMNPMSIQQSGLPQQGQNMGNPQQAQIQQRLMQQQQARMRAIDNLAFPRKILDEIQLAAPAQVRTWIELKRFAHENQATLPPDMMNRIGKYQSMVATRIQQQQQQQAQGNNGGLLNGAVSSGGLSNGGLPNGGQMQGSVPPPTSGPAMMPSAQAPPAQMVPPQAQPNQGQSGMSMPMNQPSIPTPAMLQVTPQEMIAFRAKMHVPNATDEQVRAHLQKWKMQKFQQNDPVAFNQHKAQHAAQQAAMRQAQLQRGMVPQQNVPGIAPQAPSMQPRPQPPFNLQPGAQQGQKRPGTSDDVVEIPNPNQSPQRPPTATAQQNQHPPSGPSFDQLRHMTPEQMSTLPPEQRAQIALRMQNAQNKAQLEALKRAQQQSALQQQQQQQQQQQAGQSQGQNQGPGQGQGQGQGQVQLPAQGQAQGQGQGQVVQQSPPQPQVSKPVLNITAQHRQAAQKMAVQADNSMKKGPAIQVNEQIFPAMIDKLRQMLPLVSQAEKMLAFAIAMAQSGHIPPDIPNKLCMLRTNFLQQMTKTGEVNGYISLELNKLEEMHNSFRKAMTFVMTKIQQLQNQQSKPEQARPASTQQPEPSVQPQQQPPQPPNLQQRAAENMVRSASQTGARVKSKAPPAPTTSGPPFPLGAPSPHGIPTYDGIANNLTPDKLQLPPQKKRKGNNGSAASTPANQGATPGSGQSPQLKMQQQSPDHKRQQQIKIEQQQQQQQDRRFKCSDDYCEFSVKGFEKEEELQTHIAEAHKRIENPLDFFLSSAANALDVDLDGHAKVSKLDSDAANRGKQAVATAKPQNLGPATMRREALKVEGQTPGKAKQGVVTPSPGFIKPSSPAPGRTPQSRQQQQRQPEAAPPLQKKTMLETMAEKAGIPLQKSEDVKAESGQKQASTSPVVGEDATGKDDSLTFMMAIGDALTGLENPYGDEMDYMFEPSPALTPSSSQSGLTDSTISSYTNVSEHDRLTMTFEWDPFGLGSGVQFDFSNDIGLANMGLNSTFDTTKTMAAQGIEGQQQDGGSGEKSQEGGKENKEKLGLPQVPITWDSVFHAGAGLDRNDGNWDRDAYGNSLLAGVEFFQSA